MAQTPENIKKDLVRLLGDIGRLSEQITRIINVFPDYYEDMLSLLTIVANANKVHGMIHDAVQQARVAEAFEADSEFAAQITHLLRTQEWVKKNYELALDATKKLSDLEDVTLQFYDNPHPDVIFT